MTYDISEKTINTIETAILSYSRRALKDTTEWAKHLLNNIKEKKQVDYKLIYKELENALDSEIGNLGSYPAKCWAQIKQIFSDAIDKPIRPLLKDVFPYLGDYLITMKNLEIIQKKSDDPTLDPIEKYYFNCFTYMIIIEGLYEKWIKILYYLFARAQRPPIGSQV